ncbi:hypothetical protein PNOK_0487500 [Pyrrhoderma noxium]|uniref:Uncharacterized protein n=1 Tax=Pyrrhoderma noxium TaxID=2282107 RepID=A0A286UJY9_9AGAM|nr:hypothetical protein PNOK_0487500 [Pyrrhoderma noxium]
MLTQLGYKSPIPRQAWQSLSSLREMPTSILTGPGINERYYHCPSSLVTARCTMENVLDKIFDINNNACVVPSQHILNLLSTDSIRQRDSVSQSRPKNGELRWLVPGEGMGFDDYAKCPKAES